jgi:hypothetical protein
MHAPHCMQCSSGSVHPDSAAPCVLQVLDMLLFNDLVLQHTGSVVRGWPFGPVNTPMMGQLCGAQAAFCERRRRREARAAHTGEMQECDDRTMLAEMLPRMLFAHKLGCGNRLPCR